MKRKSMRGEHGEPLRRSHLGPMLQKMGFETQIGRLVIDKKDAGVWGICRQADGGRPEIFPGSARAGARAGVF
jgi:hypothetical protein